MKALIDSGFLYAIHDSDDDYHKRVQNVFSLLPSNAELLLPTVVLVEVAYLVHAKIGYYAIPFYMEKIKQSPFNFEYIVEDDLERIQALMKQYQDAELDFVDTAIVAMAERLNVRHILTVDQRDFRIIRPHHCNHFELWP